MEYYIHKVIYKISLTYNFGFEYSLYRSNKLQATKNRCLPYGWQRLSLIGGSQAILLAKSESLDDSTIAVDVLLLKV